MDSTGWMELVSGVLGVVIGWLARHFGGKKDGSRQVP